MVNCRCFKCDGEHMVKDEEVKYVRFEDEMVLDAKQAAERLNKFFIESMDAFVAGITGIGRYKVRESNVDNGLSDFPEVLEDEVNKTVKTLTS